MLVVLKRPGFQSQKYGMLMNFALSVSEYVTTNVTAKPDSEIHFYANQIHAILWSFTYATVKLLLFQKNNLSNSILHRVKCRTEAVNHLSRSLKLEKC